MKIVGLALAAAGLSLFGLCSCGSVSSVQPVGGGAVEGLGSYDSLVVKKFTDATSPDGFSRWTADEQTAHRSAVNNCLEKMQRTTISSVSGKGRFRHVGDKPGPGRNLVVDGRITRYKEGVASLRFRIGMGAGSSYLDGEAFFRDAASGKTVGRIVIDKNSWPLGGGIAAMQTAEGFAEGAAQQVASEALKFAR